ncbi:hypothetical protein F0U61_48310 [Archangium violaceum]|uniref:hypothetical protein n=1 Tax=Archangium violaceum TaxID=83451 RepID=UPI002B2D18E0|nr:hypothetical protein F0U61_48310 [Archangium violaceum]
MGAFTKTIGGMFLGKYLNQRQRHRRGAWSRGRAYQRPAAGGLLSTPIGRLGLGSLAFLAARRFMARQRHA